MGWQPFIDALPKIKSPTILAAFVLVLLGFLCWGLYRTETGIFKILQSKLTKLQTFKIFKYAMFLIFFFATLLVILTYVYNLYEIYENKSQQTSILIYGKSYDVTENKTGTSGYNYFISTNPIFSFPAPNLNQWIEPKWTTNKQDILKLFNQSLPEEIKFDEPIFNFLTYGKALFVFSKMPVSLEINSKSKFIASSPLDEEKVSEYPFEQPIKINGRSNFIIISIKKSDLPSKYLGINVGDLMSTLISTTQLHPEQLISTKLNAVVTFKTTFDNAIYQNQQTKLSIYKIIRYLETSNYYYYIEGTCYAPEQNDKIANYIANAITNFTAPR